MASKVEIWTVATYEAWLHVTDNGWWASMQLRDANGDTFAHVSFVKEETKGPILDSLGRYHVRFPIAAYRDWIDMLRNESPVYFRVSGLFASLSTIEEPVGEGESEP